ncbi:inactive leucine-rich repeat receptor-like serine/threonine-protein kinase At1g60630 [Typha latifolia]|uniref:inactive leucine-rich repeat receptor-like serine/threonine-protein kinase At1g60630 n=1 Tax=Typha latifolia TaxID=4733 RepID=UPI003C2EC41E
MEAEPNSPRYFFLFLCFLVLRIPSIDSKSSDVDALLALKSSVDVYNSLPWRKEESHLLCTSWKGVKECSPSGRVTKLVLEFANLTGAVQSDFLAPLDELRVLSLKSNSLSGSIPDLSPLSNLKSLYLNDNLFSGEIPSSIAVLHRLKVVALSNNLLSGPIPLAFASIPRLYALLLENNHLIGGIPAFTQTSLRFFNVSSNNLSGRIPATRTLIQFNLSSFLNNSNLCGAQIERPCSKNPTYPPSPSPDYSVSSSINAFPPLVPSTHKSRNKRRLIAIVAGSIAGVLVLSLFIIAILVLVFRKKKKMVPSNQSREVGLDPTRSNKTLEEERGERGGDGKSGFSWEGDGIGKLIFCGGVGEMYSLEDLLKASAETLGRGTVGSTYKAVMESGFIVTVKRLKEAARPGAEEFRRRMEELGRLRHPNLVPLRAYFQAKEERLLVYDYFPNGSLFSLIHGSRPSGSGKPLHWTSCLKIAEDVATGLLYLHQSGLVHGNLKSSNVLLGADFESCLTDFSLLPSLLPSSTSTSNSSTFTPSYDAYNFGILLLELLTGKTPFPDLIDHQLGADIPKWVKSVREEETESGDEPESVGEKLGALVSIAMACVAAEEGKRPETKEVVRMIREARAETMVVSSNNSSDHSPGRWSDTVQSLPREHGLEGFAERD